MRKCQNLLLTDIRTFIKNYYKWVTIYDKMLNTDVLAQVYHNGLPDGMEGHISKMQELADRRGILSVSLLSNFGKDMK